MKISIDAFQGQRPRLTAHKLGAYEAQLASNARVDKADLRGWRAPLLVTSLTGTSYRSAFKYFTGPYEYWVTSANDMDWFRSPIAQDYYERVYVSDGSTLKVFANDIISTPFDQTTDYYLWGVPAPTVTPTVGGSGALERYYFYTFVNAYGEEGPGSPIGGGATVAARPTISTIQAIPANRRIVGINLYRTNSTTAGQGQYQFVLYASYFDATEAYAVGDYVLYSATPETDTFALYKCTTIHLAGAWNASHFTAGDDVTDADLGDVCASVDYSPPPSGLTGVVMLPNGIAIGFVGNEVYFSEPWLPHAWPEAYAQSIEEEIIGIGIFGNNAVLVTDGFPYLITGSAPEQMSLVKYGDFFPCLSKRSIVTGMGGVMFATREGLAHATLEGCSIITTDFVTPGDWEEYYPATMHANFYDGKYFAFYLYGSESGGIIIDFKNNLWTELPFYAQAGYVETKTGDYFLVVDDDSTAYPKPQCIKQWNADPYNFLYYRWRSRKYLFSSNLNLSAARITIDKEFYNAIMELLDENEYILNQNEALFASSIAQINGDQDAFTGQAGDTILVTIDGSEYDNIDISACADIADVAEAINTATGNGEASVDDDGYLQIRGVYGVSIADGSSTAQTVIAELFSVEAERTDTAVPLGGSINESSLCEYSVLDDEILAVEDISISDSITFRLYADGVLKFSRTVSDDGIFRLPAGYKYRDCEIQIEGYIPVRKVEVATSALELMNG